MEGEVVCLHASVGSTCQHHSTQSPHIHTREQLVIEPRVSWEGEGEGQINKHCSHTLAPLPVCTEYWRAFLHSSRMVSSLSPSSRREKSISDLSSSGFLKSITCRCGGECVCGRRR